LGEIVAEIVEGSVFPAVFPAMIESKGLGVHPKGEELR
jgi:hypothetical protein